VQLAPAAKAPGLAHVDEGPTTTAYSLPAGTEYELTVMAAEPVFLRMTFDTALVSPATTLPKANVAGVTVVCAKPNAGKNRHDAAVDNNRTAFWNFRIRFSGTVTWEMARGPRVKSAKGKFVPRNKVGNSRGLDAPVLRVFLKRAGWAIRPNFDLFTSCVAA
jgi:hypothetical protein